MGDDWNWNLNITLRSYARSPVSLMTAVWHVMKYNTLIRDRIFFCMTNLFEFNKSVYNKAYRNLYSYILSLLALKLVDNNSRSQWNYRYVKQMKSN